MMHEILTNLIASTIFAIFIFVVGKLVNDWFYLEIRLPKKKEKKEEQKGRKEDIKEEKKEGKKKDNNRFIKIYRKFPWKHAYMYAEKTAKRLRGESAEKKAEELYAPTIIIGIGRGGAIYGSIFSYYMKETPMLAIDRKYLYNDAGERIGEDWYYPFDIPKELISKVLLVAGEYHSGKTMQKFYERLKAIGADEIRSCVLYYQIGLPDQVGEPDYYGIHGKRDCLMPWQQKQFLRTWKDGNDAKVRNYSLGGSMQLDSLKDGFFLMRHAKTNANVEDIFIGSGSPQENIIYEGITEARNVGVFLNETVGGLDVIYSSPISRCIQTAKEIQIETGGEIVEDDRLIEVDFGKWEGVKRSDIPSAEYDAYLSNQQYQIPGSKDSYNACQKRAAAFLEELKQQCVVSGKRILVVTHKTIGRIMVQSIEHKEHLHYRDIPMENASLRKVVVMDDTMNIPYYIKVLDGDIVV